VAQTEINLPFITADASGPKHLTYTLTRSKLEQLTMDLVEKTLGPCRQALQDAGKTTAQIDEVILVGGQTRMPLVQQKVKEFWGKEPNRSVNPDEVVAIGAAIQAGVLGGEVKDVLLLDVTPLSLGVETMGGVMTALIQRNTTIPVRKTEVFSTAEDGQSAVDVHVLQGERPMAGDNNSLGRFRLDGIPASPRGVPQIEVTFDIDANGILNVSARDKASGKEQRVTITASTNLSKADIERMVGDAKQNEAQDQRRKELVEARNNADSTAYQAEKVLREQGAAVPADVRADVESRINTLKGIMNSEDANAIRSATQAVQGAVSAAANPQPSSGDDGGSSETPEGEVVEGDFRQV
jgi:molecular chaperone DnaK